jgi:hypothetical protein
LRDERTIPKTLKRRIPFAAVTWTGEGSKEGSLRLRFTATSSHRMTFEKIDPAEPDDRD